MAPVRISVEAARWFGPDGTNQRSHPAWRDAPPASGSTEGEIKVRSLVTTWSLRQQTFPHR